MKGGFILGLKDCTCSSRSGLENDDITAFSRECRRQSSLLFSASTLLVKNCATKS